MAFPSREIFGTFNVDPILVNTEIDEDGFSQSVNGPSDPFLGGNIYLIEIDVPALTGDTFTLRGEFQVFSGDDLFETLDNSQIVAGSILGSNPSTGIVVNNFGDGSFEITYPVSLLDTFIGSRDLIRVRDEGNQTEDVLDDVILEFACFAEGTAIATPEGQRAIEDLAVGDMVCTGDGRHVAVRWIGYQRIATRFGPAERLLPVRIKRGALDIDQPGRDLVVTADHGVLIDGYLINAGVLVGSPEIDWVPLSDFGQTFRLYHLETENHEIILAEGAKVETFVDYNGRQCFDNFAEYTMLYGECNMIPEMDLLRISARRLLPPALAQRFGLSTDKPTGDKRRHAWPAE